MSTPTTGFNADERATQRASLPIIIGGETFAKRRSTNELQRELQKLARAQARINRQQEQHADLIDALDGTTSEDGITPDEKEIKRLRDLTGLPDEDVDAVTDKLDELSEAARVLTYQMIDAQLHKDGEAPTVAFLEEHLDAEDVMPLVRYLSGAPADPPVPATSESTSG